MNNIKSKEVQNNNLNTNVTQNSTKIYNNSNMEVDHNVDHLNNNKSSTTN